VTLCYTSKLLESKINQSLRLLGFNLGLDFSFVDKSLTLALDDLVVWLNDLSSCDEIRLVAQRLGVGLCS
jgi:hypothetical protein